MAEPNYRTTRWFLENRLAIEMNKTEVKMNKSVYLGLYILNMTKVVMYEYLQDCKKLKYGKRAKPCYMDMDSFMVHIKTEDVYEDLIGDVETRFDTSNYEVKRPLSRKETRKS